jgi:hypothetical protein
VQYYKISVIMLRSICKQKGILLIPRLKMHLVIALERDNAALRKRNLKGNNSPSVNYLQDSAVSNLCADVVPLVDLT